MKKLLIGLFASAIMASTASASGLWDMVKNASADGKIKPKMYVLETAGVNNRVYVFDNKVMKSICTLTYSGGDINVPTMVCKTYKEMGLK